MEERKEEKKKIHATSLAFSLVTEKLNCPYQSETLLYDRNHRSGNRDATAKFARMLEAHI